MARPRRKVAHALYAEVQRTFESARQISRTARDIRSLRNGRLNICALPAIGSTVLPGIVAEFSRAHPDVPVAIDIRASATVIERASRSQIDLGIAATSTVENPAVTRRTLANTRAVCAMPKGHPLSALNQIGPKDIHGMDFISLGNMDTLRIQIDKACDEAGVSRNMHIECTLAAACLEFVAEGAGITIVDDISAWKMRHVVDFRPFVPALYIELSLYRPWGSLPSAISSAFTDHLVRRIKEISKKASGTSEVS